MRDLFSRILGIMVLHSYSRLILNAGDPFRFSAYCIPFYRCFTTCMLYSFSIFTQLDLTNFQCLLSRKLLKLCSQRHKRLINFLSIIYRFQLTFFLCVTSLRICLSFITILLHDFFADNQKRRSKHSLFTFIIVKFLYI